MKRTEIINQFIYLIKHSKANKITLKNDQKQHIVIDRNKDSFVVITFSPKQEFFPKIEKYQLTDEDIKKALEYELNYLKFYKRDIVIQVLTNKE